MKNIEKEIYKFMENEDRVEMEYSSEAGIMIKAVDIITHVLNTSKIICIGFGDFSISLVNPESCRIENDTIIMTSKRGDQITLKKF